MEQIIVLIRERDWENTRWSNYFAVKDAENPEQSFRDAIAEFLSTKEGVEAIKHSCEDFNWGDAVNKIPCEILQKYGIREIADDEPFTVKQLTEIVVNQDEVLIPDTYYSLEK